VDQVRGARAIGLVALVLAGGRGSRLGGTAKGGLDVGGRTLLDRALAAVVDAGEVVVVGDPPDADAPARRVRWAVEEPRYGGPVAAIRAGLDALPRPADSPAAGAATRVAVLAVDMPHVSAATVRRLLAAVPPGAPDDEAPDGAVLLGPDGRRQLALVLRRASLAGALPPATEVTGMPLHRLLGGLHLVEVASEGDEGRDVDTWADLEAARDPR